MRPITDIIIHCADTPPEMDIGSAEIRKWHTDPTPQGRGWADIGYHYIIRRDGHIEKGRDESVIGSHVAGHNTNSIGVCLVGGMSRDKKGADCNFTRHQWASLSVLVDDLRRRYPGIKITGHRDYADKACPTFDVAAWMGEE